MSRKHLIPIILELTGIIIVSGGIGLELALGGSIYLVMITAGSLLIGTGGFLYAKIFREGRR